MQFEELLREREREGREQGRSEGRNEGRTEERSRILALIAAMAAAGEAEQISRLSSDPVFLKEMLAKHHLLNADTRDTQA